MDEEAYGQLVERLIRAAKSVSSVLPSSPEEALEQLVLRCNEATERSAVLDRQQRTLEARADYLVRAETLLRGALVELLPEKKSDKETPVLLRELREACFHANRNASIVSDVFEEFHAANWMVDVSRIPLAVRTALADKKKYKAELEESLGIIEDCRVQVTRLSNENTSVRMGQEEKAKEISECRAITDKAFEERDLLRDRVAELEVEVAALKQSPLVRLRTPLAEIEEVCFGYEMRYAEALDRALRAEGQLAVLNGRSSDSFRVAMLTIAEDIGVEVGEGETWAQVAARIVEKFKEKPETAVVNAMPTSAEAALRSEIERLTALAQERLEWGQHLEEELNFDRTCVSGPEGPSE